MTQDERIAALEARLLAVEDRNAIENLMALYLDASDGGWNGPSHDGQRVETLFARRGVGVQGRGESRGQGRDPSALGTVA